MAQSYLSALFWKNRFFRSPIIYKMLFLSKLLFLWFEPLGATVQKRQIRKSDLKHLSGNFVEPLSVDLTIASLTQLIWICKEEFVITSALKFLTSCCLFLDLWFAESLISVIGDKDSSMLNGFLCAFGIYLLNQSETIIGSHFYHKMELIGIQVESLFIPKLLRKALRISPEGRVSWSSGSIMNLLLDDLSYLQEGMANMHCVWNTPLEVIFCVYVLWSLLGSTTLATIITMSLVLTASYCIVMKIKILQELEMATKDKSLTLVAEICERFRHLKLMCLENVMLNRVIDLRRLEEATLSKMALFSSAVRVLSLGTPYLICVVTFSLMSSEDRSAEKIYAIVAIFSLLGYSLKHFPQALSTINQAVISFNRIQKFLSAPEISSDRNKRKQIVMKNASFSWHNNGLVLENISIDLKSPSFIVVTGLNGSGKSSFLSAVLGDLVLKNGKVNIANNLSYLSQSPWIWKASIRDNIIFGKPFDKHNYDMTLSLCCLNHDIAQKPNSDLSYAYNLSGGQKQRVALARAIYANADVIVLDGPISAVDSKVGRTIAKRLLSQDGYLCKKIRLVASNNEMLKEIADLVVTLDDGKIISVQSNSRKTKVIENVQLQQNSEDKIVEQIDDFQKPVTDSSENAECKGNSMKKMNYSWSWCIQLFSKKAICALLALFVLDLAFQTATRLVLAQWSTGTDGNQLLQLYITTGFISVLVGYCFWSILGWTLIKLSSKMHHTILQSINLATVECIESVPVGNILSLAGQDMNVLDNQLRSISQNVLEAVGRLSVSLITMLIANPTMVCLILPLATIYWSLMAKASKVEKSLKSLHQNFRIPMHEHLQQAIDGATTIRAFGAFDLFEKEMNLRMKPVLETQFFMSAASSWRSILSESMSNLIVLLVAAGSVISRETIGAGVAALLLSYSQQIAHLFDMVLSRLTDLNTAALSISRIHEFSSQLELEDREDGMEVADDWPEEGNVSFENFCIKYANNEHLSLRNFNINFAAGEKVVVVGRTGSGKSTMALALFRILESHGGKITIDGQDIGQLRLHDLRNRITIVPQDASLFSGTLRSNIDPLEQFSDDQILRILEKMSLKPVIDSLPQGLQSPVKANSTLLSNGQCQLVFLCSAFLHKRKIIVFDEASSHLDEKAEMEQMRFINEHFKHCTLIVIAHRLRTTSNANKILVIDNGQAKEFGDPVTLLANPNSAYYKLRYEQAGFQ